jgi:L-amino acid N-acyltransferase YncA
MVSVIQILRRYPSFFNPKGGFMSVNHMRLATLEDANAILSIYEPYVLHTSYSFEESVPDIESFKQRMRETMDRFPWLVYERNGMIVGFAYAAPFNVRSAYDWSAQTSVYVDEKHHGLGIGNALYVSLLDILTYQGYCTAYALIVSPNEKSEKLHRSLGFKSGPMFKKVGYKLGQWHDLHWFYLQLNDHPAKPERPIHLNNESERFRIQQRLLNRS